MEQQHQGQHRHQVVLEVRQVEQPDLPTGINWPQHTRDWWQAWGESDLAANATALDWQYLADTAVIHATLWGDGDKSVLPQLHMRDKEIRDRLKRGRVIPRRQRPTEG